WARRVRARLSDGLRGTRGIPFRRRHPVLVLALALVVGAMGGAAVQSAIVKWRASSSARRAQPRAPAASEVARQPPRQLATAPAVPETPAPAPPWPAPDDEPAPPPQTAAAPPRQAVASPPPTRDA